MKPRHLNKNIQRSIAAILILVLSSCSSSSGGREIGSNTSSNRHPDLLLQSGHVSPSRLITDAELVNSKGQSSQRERLSVIKTLKAAIIATPEVTMNLAMTTGVILSGLPIDIPDWTFSENVPSLSDLYTKPTLRSKVCSPLLDTQVKLTGTEIRYVSSKNGRNVQIARARGSARVTVSDRFGSYYCRADEIHYRAATNEIILNGRASVSAAYAPGIHDYGLARVDLTRGILEYSSNEKPRHLFPDLGAEGLAMVQPKVSQP